MMGKRFVAWLAMLAAGVLLAAAEARAESCSMEFGSARLVDYSGGRCVGGKLEGEVIARLASEGGRSLDFVGRVRQGQPVGVFYFRMPRDEGDEYRYQHAICLAKQGDWPDVHYDALTASGRVMDTYQDIWVPGDERRNLFSRAGVWADMARTQGGAAFQPLPARRLEEMITTYESGRRLVSPPTPLEAANAARKPLATPNLDALLQRSGLASGSR